MRDCVAGETGDCTAPGRSGEGYVVATTSGPLAQGDGAGAGDAAARSGDGAGQATGDGGAGGTTGRAAAACSRWYAARISAMLGAGAGAGEGGEGRAASVPPVAAKSNAMAGAGDSGSAARRFGDGSSSNDTTATGRLGLGGRVRVPRCRTRGSSSPSDNSSESDAGAGAGRGAAGGGGAAFPRYGPAVAYCDGGSGGRPSSARQAGAPPRCAARACGDRNSRLQARHTHDAIVFAASRGGTYAFGDGAGGGRGSQAASSRASPVQTPQVQGPSTGAGRHATCARGPRHDAHATMRPSGRAQRSQRVPLSRKASAQTALSLIAVRGRRGAELRGRRGALGARRFAGASTSSGSSPSRFVAFLRRGPSITTGFGGGGGFVGRAASSARRASSARALRTGCGVTPLLSLK